MATRHPDTADRTNVSSGHASATRTPPLWVWAVGIVVLGTALAMVVTMSTSLFMGGGH
jgi:hypothetical protein